MSLVGIAIFELGVGIVSASEETGDDALCDPALALPVDDDGAEQAEAGDVKAVERLDALDVLADGDVGGLVATHVRVEVNAVGALGDEEVVDNEHLGVALVHGVHGLHLASGHLGDGACGGLGELGVDAVEDAVAHESLWERGARKLPGGLQLVVPVARAFERVGGGGTGEQESGLGAERVRAVRMLASEPGNGGQRVGDGDGGEVVARR